MNGSASPAGSDCCWYCRTEGQFGQVASGVVKADAEGRATIEMRLILGEAKSSDVLPPRSRSVTSTAARFPPNIDFPVQRRFAGRPVRITTGLGLDERRLRTMVATDGTTSRFPARTCRSPSCGGPGRIRARWPPTGRMDGRSSTDERIDGKRFDGCDRAARPCGSARRRKASTWALVEAKDDAGRACSLATRYIWGSGSRRQPHSDDHPA